MLRRGKTVYGGPVSSALEYFKGACKLPHPAEGGFFCLPEWLVDVISVEHKGVDVDLAEHFAASPSAAAMGKLVQASLESDSKLEMGESKHKPGTLKALSTLLKYRMSTHYKSPEFLGPRIGDKVLFGLIILSLYFGIGDKEDVQSIASTSALLFFISALCGYGAAAFVPSLTLDRPLFYRELADGCYTPIVYCECHGVPNRTSCLSSVEPPLCHHVAAAMCAMQPLSDAHSNSSRPCIDLSKFIEEGFLCIFTTLLFCVQVFYGLSLQGSFWIFCANYYLTTMTGICLAYAVAALVPTMDAANALLPTYVTLCLYFGGLFIVFEKIPTGWYWFSWLSFMRYSWGAHMLNQYQNTSTGEVGAFYDTDYKNQTECFVSPVPTIAYDSTGAPMIAMQDQEVCRHDIEGKVVTVLEFYGLGVEGEIMGSLGLCIGMSALLTLIFATCGACALTHVRFNTR